MRKPIKIILANAPIRSGNRGCTALTITTMYIIDKLFQERGVDYELYLCDSQDSPKGSYFYEICGKSIKYEAIYYTPYNLESFIKVAGRKKLKQTYMIFKTADYILDIGQGDSFADIYGESRFNQIDRIHKLANKYSKRYCILPQTIGPFSDPLIKSNADKSIANSALCMARDKQSFEYVKNNVPSQTTIKEYIDVAFLMPYTKMEFDSSFIHVGLNISALMWNGGYSRNNQFGLKDDYKSLIRSIIDYFLSQSNVKLHIVPHVVEQERGVENDYEVSYNLWREYNNPNLQLAPFALGPIEIKSYISGLDFFMGSRMHATIGAFSSGVPVVPMAYSRKFNGLFEDTLDYHYMTDLKAQTKENVLSIVTNAFKNRSNLKEIINNRMQTTVKERERLMYNELRKFFNL